MSLQSSPDPSLDVQMLGTRGLPNRYGGSETCVEEVGWRLSSQGHRVRVFCRRRVTGSREKQYRGMELVALPSVPVQVFDTLSHSLTALTWLLGRRQRTPSTVLHFHGSGNGALLPIARLARLPTVVTVDGADWRRAKWGPITRRLLRMAARMTARLADVVVADSDEASRLYREKWGISPVYIPYGMPEVDDGKPSKASALEHLGLIRRQYFLFVGRFVPEKEIRILVEAHGDLPMPRPRLVLVGGTPEDSAYARCLKDLAGLDVLFAGKLSGADLDPLMRGALTYVQPSSVTGKATVEALTS